MHSLSLRKEESELRALFGLDDVKKENTNMVKTLHEEDKTPLSNNTNSNTVTKKEYVVVPMSDTARKCKTQQQQEEEEEKREEDEDDTKKVFSSPLLDNNKDEEGKTIIKAQHDDSTLTTDQNNLDDTSNNVVVTYGNINVSSEDIINSSVVDILAELRKSEESNAQLQNENNRLRASLEQFQNNSNSAQQQQDDDDEWNNNRIIQDLKSKHKSVLHNLVEENSKQLSKFRSELQEKDAMIKNLEENVSRCIRKLKDCPADELLQKSQQTSLLSTTVVQDRDTQLKEEEEEEENEDIMVQMRKEMEAKELKLAAIHASLIAYQGERLDFQEELKQLNHLVVKLQDSKEAWNKKEVHLLKRIRKTEREKARMEKMLMSEIKASQELEESLRAQLGKSSTNSTKSPTADARSVHFEDSSLFDAKPKFEDKQAWEEEDSASKQSQTKIVDTANKDKSKEFGHKRDDAYPPTDASSETSEYSISVSDSIHKRDDVSRLTLECTESCSDSNYESFSSIASTIFNESIKPLLENSISGNINLSDHTGDKGLSRKQGNSVKDIGNGTAKAEQLQIVLATSKDTKDKLKMLTKNPELWLKCKARLSSSNYGTSVLAVQTVLREMAEEHPEIEEMFAAREEQQHLLAITEMKKKKANESSVSQRLSTFVSSINPLSQSSKQIGPKS